ncbi:MAG TPA: hypothetical protein VN327_00395 [Pseudonocardiaceae bacterium]|nr:hypothetical protein [Pseudonocardiaceae bacterium]
MPVLYLLYHCDAAEQRRHLLGGQLAAGEPTIVQLGVGGLRMAAAATVRSRVRISHRRAGAHCGEAGWAQFGAATIMFRAPGCGFLGTACLPLRGRWQELASASGMHGHADEDGPCARSAHPVSRVGREDSRRARPPRVLIH